jgi:minor extracellular serine protease Vpr
MEQNKSTKILGTFLMSLFLLASVACQKKQNLNSGLLGAALMSDRPDVEIGSQVYLLELKNDALALSSKRNSQGLLEIDEDQKLAIEKEQAEAEVQLGKLSPDIRVLFRYKYVLNAISIVAPIEMVPRIKAMPFVKKAEIRKHFKQLKTTTQSVRFSADPKSGTQSAFNPARTSVNFIEAQAAYEQGVKGQGIRVGVLDTGIDYTHLMLGGTGSEEDYKSVNPDGPSAFFPNKKVVGGIDLVGSQFDSASLDPAKRIPLPDLNPIDQSGHGTHVSGTIAGVGDGINSYDGVAPEATLYAIKVFGSGSTGDEVVIAGLEYAVDPNQDGKFDDQLNVINLSLGGANGTPYELYNKAVTNLTRMGTFMVASAGNESDIPFIVGSPSTSDEALSVAAQIDHSDHNWRFKTIGLFIDGDKIAAIEALEASIAKPISEVGNVEGALIYGGLGDRDYTEEEAASIKGKIILIDRGVVTFAEKMARGEKAGAIAVIVAQNREEPPFTMGGDGHVEIPAVMISQEMGKKIKDAMEAGSEVRANFKNPDIIEKPELIGAITDFSSRGPRSYDLLIKPEITAPGQNIISAEMGGGAKSVQMSGTSMSGPHMAGVMALMKQKYPGLTTRELKSVVMSTAVSVKTLKGQTESVARQGAGQVLVSRAIKAQFVTEPSALSLGLQQIENEKRFSNSIRLKSLGDDDIQLSISLETSSPAVSMVEQKVSLKPRGLTDIKLNWNLKASLVAGLEDEVTGWVVLKSGDWSQKIPFLVRIQKISNILLTQSHMGSSSARDAEGSEASFEFTNKGIHSGDIWTFNLLGLDDQKPEGSDALQSSECDVKAVGYRIAGSNLEVAVKFFRRVSSWPVCEVSVMFDQDGDKKPEAELALTTGGRIPGLSGDTIVSTLLDFKKAQALRKEAVEKSKSSDKRVELVLKEAVIAQDEAVAGDLRSAVILKMPLSDLISIAGARPQIQVVASANDSKNVEADDYLKNSKRWLTLSLNPQDQSWMDLRNWTLQAGQIQKVSLTRGAATDSLMIVYPQNSLDSRGLNDYQLQVFKPKYK